MHTAHVCSVFLLYAVPAAPWECPRLRRAARLIQLWPIGICYGAPVSSLQQQQWPLPCYAARQACTWVGSVGILTVSPSATAGTGP
jgi:hypothetical protein